jgi:hypothetical protein
MQPYSSNYDYQGNYQNAVTGYNQAQQNTMNTQNSLSDYQKNMADPAKMYGNYLQNAQQSYGFNPQDLLQAQKSMANTNTTIANLPQATQQQGNYYGTTAGAMANNYSQQAGNLQALLAGQGNSVNALQSILGATQNQANQQAGLGLQGQQLNVQALTAILQNALGYQNSQQNMVTNARGEQSDYGGYLNAQQQAKAALLSAQAQQQSAAASAAYNQQQAAQIAYNMELQRQYASQQQQVSSPLTVLQGNSQNIQGGGGPISLTGSLQGNSGRLQG